VLTEQVAKRKFLFSKLEIPSKINFGGKQNLVTHELIGGNRVIDAMGKSDSALAWSGMFTASGRQAAANTSAWDTLKATIGGGNVSAPPITNQMDALSRARYLDYLRVSGTICTLTWSEFNYTVICESFEADFERFYQIPYKISFAILTNNVAALPAGIDELLAKDAARIDALMASVGTPAMLSNWQKLKAAFAAIKKFAAATTAQITAIRQQVVAIQAQIKAQIANISNTLKQITTLGGIVPVNGAAKWVQKTSNQAVNTAQLGDLHNLQSTVGRLAKNVGVK
jgi:hypothetical protein